jgi:RNA-directed DNA polymerase
MCCINLSILAEKWRVKQRKRLRLANENSSWWHFLPFWQERIEKWLGDFCAGQHKFSPLSQYKFSDEVVQVWSYLDKLILHLIINIIRPTFKHIISPLCLHLTGPSAIKGATRRIRTALTTSRFKYAMRIDIKSYYASIDHRILLKQIRQNYDDPKILRYLEDIITIPVDVGGNVYLPKKGIPRRSALSPFFGALYLSDLDKAFEKKSGIFYLRYMDDIIILIESKRRYHAARKRLFSILKDLRLKVSPHKTKMGELKRGFHFLGVNFAVTRIPQSQIQVKVGVHKRTPLRALNKVQTLRHDAVDPATMQRYLMRWATWWYHAVGVDIKDLLYGWICCAAGDYPGTVWVGATCYYRLAIQCACKS